MAVYKKEVRHLGYRCIGPTITTARIERLKHDLKSKRELTETKNYFAVLAGKTRLAILYLLQKEKELCVCDMADILDTTVSAVSHQLKILRTSKFVETRKDAQTVFYSLTSEGRKELQNHF
jgi:DNA-binding transcriptional ArsR family regulator